MKIETLQEYQTAALKTANRKQVYRIDRLQNAALGLCGEAGEFADIIKKIVYHGHQPENSVIHKMKHELGDILWYIAQASSALGTDLQEIAEMNIEKLKQRYPEGFSEEASQNRAV